VNIARIIYDNYPAAAELIPEDKTTDIETLYKWACRQRNLGDSLLRFIIIEAKEGGEGSDGKVDPERVGMALTRGLEDLDAVIEALAQALDQEAGNPQTEEKACPNSPQTD
jgi:hypothetical protein